VVARREAARWGQDYIEGVTSEAIPRASFIQGFNMSNEYPRWIVPHSTHVQRPCGRPTDDGHHFVVGGGDPPPPFVAGAKYEIHRNGTIMVLVRNEAEETRFMRPA
jgi:hypothetical protein